MVLLNQDTDIIDDSSCYLAYIKNEQLEHDQIFDFYSSYINRDWIFYSDNLESVNNLLKYDYDAKDLKLYGIIIPMNSAFENEIENDENYPIFKIGDNYTKYIQQWDIRTSDKNTYFTLKINLAIDYFPENYLLILATFIFALVAFTFIKWKIGLCKVGENLDIPFQSNANILVYISLFLYFFYLLKSIFIRGYKVYEIEEQSELTFIEIGIIGCTITFKGYYWLLIFLLCKGVGITVQNLTLESCKNLLKIYFATFFLLNVDIFIITVKIPTIRLNAAELKNIFLYILFVYFISIEIKKNLIFLENKVQYAEVVSPEHVQILKYKMKLFKLLRLFVVIFYALFIISVLLHKTVFYSFDEKVLETFDYASLDALLVCAVLYLFRPKQLPENYDIFMGDNIDVVEGEIYLCKLPKYSEANVKIERLKNKDVNKCLKNNDPILVVGPNNNSSTKTSTKNSSSSINKYFLNLYVGNVDKN